MKVTNRAYNWLKRNTGVLLFASMLFSAFSLVMIYYAWSVFPSPLAFAHLMNAVGFAGASIIYMRLLDKIDNGEDELGEYHPLWQVLFGFLAYPIFFGSVVKEFIDSGIKLLKSL